MLWGSAFPGIKAIYEEWERLGVDSSFSNRLLLAGVRFFIAGIALLVIAKTPFKEWRQTPKLPLLLYSLGQTYFQYVMFYTALAVSSAVLGGLLTATGSLWWLLLAPLILKSPWPTPLQWGLFAIGAAGVIFAVYQPGSGSGDPMLGALLFCGSTLSGSIGIIILQRVLKTMGARAATGFGLLIGGVLLSLTGYQAWGSATQIFSPKIWILTFYLSLVSAVGFGVWNYLSHRFPVNLLAGYRFFIPICAVLESSLLVKGEAPGWGIFFGGALVLVAIVGLQRVKDV